MSGKAGAIAALVVLNHIIGDSALLDFAIRLGDELIETAHKEAFGWSWESPGWTNHRNLTGFSHGAAGSGCALLELFDACGLSKYREAARDAFEYERHWFDPHVGNWPDFRRSLSPRPRKQKRYSYLPFWCHGAPGIALSRLRAFQILDDDTCKAEAVAALKTTRASIESALDTWTGNFSMCHGLTGNCEALLYGAEVLGPEFAMDAEVAVRVANYGIERYCPRTEPWPCGTHCGETPNLMLGLAGIGHFICGCPNRPSRRFWCCERAPGRSEQLASSPGAWAAWKQWVADLRLTRLISSL